MQHILLVEDDPDIQLAMIDILQEEGFDVTVANNGAEALNILANSDRLSYTILLDLMMPVMDGYEFRKNMLANPDYAHIPVIVVSADRNGRDKTRQMGISAFLEKPIDLTELLETIAAVQKRA